MSTPATSRLREVLAVGMYEGEAPPPPAMAQEHLWEIISLLFAKTNLMKKLIDKPPLGPRPGYNSLGGSSPPGFNSLGASSRHYGDELTEAEWDKEVRVRTEIRQKITNIDSQLERWVAVPEAYR